MGASTGDDVIERVQLLVAQAKYEEAEPLLRQAVTQSDRCSEPQAVASYTQQLADLLAATGRSEEAIPLYRQALTMQREVLGPTHPALTTTLHNMALACSTAGRADEASSLWAEARALVTQAPEAS
jgi:tetratricopeptide (TPR) repeat protein